MHRSQDTITAEERPEDDDDDNSAQSRDNTSEGNDNEPATTAAKVTNKPMS